MRINFFFVSDHSPVVCQDDYYIDMYGDVYKYVEYSVGSCPLHKVLNNDIGWEIVCPTTVTE
jgi:hypothetical protein